MMFSFFKFVPASLSFLTLALVVHSSSTVGASTLEYLAEPKLIWEAQTGVIMDSNGVFINPSDTVTVVTEASGNLHAFDPFSGDELWTFTPPSNDNLPVGCRGGATFSTTGTKEYITYSVIDDPNGLDPFTRVMSLNMNGTLQWVSTPLEGIAAGSPVASFDGRYIFLTHNSNVETVGHFSVLDSLDAQVDIDVLPFYSEINDANPFTPPGIYHNPEEGYFDGGQFNTNDIIVWAHAPSPLQVGVGTGASFAFQFPIGFVSPSFAVGRQASGGLSSILLSKTTQDWQAISAPAMTNKGRSLYWSVSRGQFRSWVGKAGENVNRFDRLKTNDPEFARGNPRWSAPPNTPTLSSDPEKPMIFAGSASNQFIKMDYLMDPATALVRDTASPIWSRAIVSPDDKFVYFAEFSGTVHQANTTDLVDTWAIPDFGALDGEMSLTSDGSMLIVGDLSGKVSAFQVAQGPTSAPTSSPTQSPTQTTAEPSTAPSVTAPTGFRPTVKPILQPTSRPTRAPVAKPTASPTLPVVNSISGAKARASVFALVMSGLLALSL